MYVYQIALDIPLRSIYSYTHTTELAIGQRVTVLFRNKEQVGFVLSCINANEFADYPVAKLSAILSIHDTILPEQFINLVHFASDYYHHPIGATLFTGLPTLLRKTKSQETESSYLQYFIATQDKLNSRSKKLVELYANLVNNTLSTKQLHEVYNKNPNSILKEWLEKKLIIEVFPEPATTQNELALNSEQQLVVTQMTQKFNQFSTNILFGITGSGKTEVFLHLIRNILLNKQQVLILVPEINLTPQLATRFNNRFPYANIITLNSEISDKQRLNAWNLALSGTSQIILGTRLSVFTSFKNLGLIIVDEEHDDSFKQNDGLRYHARDLAVWRAKQYNIPILLASATPALETLYNYKLGKYSLYKLTTRAVTSAELPKIEVVNLQHYPVNFAGINQPAITALGECMLRKEMALVFINRRGYAPIITCYECGWISECRYCSTKMVYHHLQHQLKCHHCGYQTAVPPACPSCKNQYLHTIGHGTQKLEEFLRQQFPSAKIERVDRDTTNSKKSWEDIYRKVANNEIDILVGTQMLAKGHDFPNLTLVIGLNLDNALFSYDFRASEDMFNIITQVSGRAGRADKVGVVLLQTNYPDHPVYQFLKEHDFNGFINQTLRERKMNNLPPFCFLALIKFSSIKENSLLTALHDLYKAAKEIPHHNVTIFPAIKAVMYKSHNRFRGQMLINSNNRNDLHQYLNKLTNELAKLKNITVAIDVDPLEV